MKHSKGYEFRLTPKGTICKINEDEEIMIDIDNDGDLVGVFLWSEILGGWIEIDYDKLRPHAIDLIQQRVNEYKDMEGIGNEEE